MAQNSELACVYSALILHDDDVPITVSPIIILLQDTLGFQVQLDFTGFAK